MIQELLSRLDKVTSVRKDRWKACCPAHSDNSPSLAIQELANGQILLRCFAGCEAVEVVHAVGLTLADLFPEGGQKHYRGWQQLEKSYQDKNKEGSVFHSKAILVQANSMRSRGERLSPSELEVERQAYLKVRDHEHRNG